MEGWVSPDPGCIEQLAHGCYATTRSQWDSNPRPRGCWSSGLTTRLSRHMRLLQCSVLVVLPASLISRLQNAAARLIFGYRRSEVQNTSRTRSPVFIGFMFLSAFSLKSLCWPIERWTAVRLRICHPTSPVWPRRWRSISCDHPPHSNW